MKHNKKLTVKELEVQEVSKEISSIVLNFYNCAYEEGYHKAMHDFNIIHGKDAKRFLKQVDNPKPMSKKQKKFLDEIGLLSKQIKCQQ